jgi:hypothetical protein
VTHGAVRLEQKKSTADDGDSAEIAWLRLSNGGLLCVEWVTRRQCDIANGKLDGSCVKLKTIAAPVATQGYA